ncbi:hypothetical protein A9G31_10430 [Gilliamella sp. Gris1-4]|nr:hypothetical protein A9G31_10430 [Gilliamella apicola]
MRIYESLLKLDKMIESSFHVLPIQNIKAIKSEAYYSKYKKLMENLCIFEKTVTQPFFDSLVLPSNQIKKSMEVASQIFNSDATLFTTAGSTISNQIAINSLSKKSRVLVQKSVHQSIHFSLQNYNIYHDYINEETICNERFLTEISSDHLNEIIQNKYDTLIINSQSYEGLMLDMEPFLNSVFHNNKWIKNVIIDEAWGGWTFFNKEMRHKSAPYIAKKLNEEFGVNFVVIQSAHKSFFSLRQAGLIHVYSDELFLKNIRDSHFKLHTTSPSYPILASTELGIVTIVNWVLEPSRCILLIHDMQQYFLSALSLVTKENLINNCASILSVARTESIPVVYTAQCGNMTVLERGLLKDFWGTGMNREYKNIEIVPQLKPEERDLV